MIQEDTHMANLSRESQKGNHLGDQLYSKFFNTSFQNSSTWTRHTIGGTNTYISTRNGAYSELALTLTTIQSGYEVEGRIRGFSAQNAQSEIPVYGNTVHAGNDSGKSVTRRWVGRWNYVGIETKGNVSGPGTDMTFEMWQGKPVDKINEPDRIEVTWLGSAGALSLSAPSIDKVIDLLGAKEATIQVVTPTVAAGAATFSLDILTSPDNVTWDNTTYVTLISAQAKDTIVSRPLSVDARYIKLRETTATANPASGEDTKATVSVKY